MTVLSRILSNPDRVVESVGVGSLAKSVDFMEYSAN